MNSKPCVNSRSIRCTLALIIRWISSRLNSAGRDSFLFSSVILILNRTNILCYALLFVKPYLWYNAESIINLFKRMKKLSKNEGVAVGVALIVVFILLFYGNEIFNAFATASGGGEQETAADQISDRESLRDISAEGLIVEYLVPGSGVSAKNGDSISIHYKGSLSNGTTFDSSYDKGEPITFSLGEGEVILGFDQGIV